MKIIYAGPFNSNGVYKGGISAIVNDVYDNYIRLKNIELQNLDVIKLETCQIKRTKEHQGHINIYNILNSIYILIDLIKKVHKKNIECVYYNSSIGIPLLKDLLILYIIKRLYRVKSIIHIHFADIEKIISHNQIIKNVTILLLKKMDNIVFLSKKTRDDFLSLGIESIHTTVIYNFQNIYYTPKDIENKIKNIKKTNTLELVFLGSISKRKGILDLLDAISNLNIKYNLHICGQITDKSIRDIYRNKIKKINTGQIIEHGYTSGENKRNILNTAHILILPSYGEGFPVVLLEGIAAGCALISTDVGASSEVFLSKNCIFTPIGNVNALKTNIELFKNKNFLLKMCLDNYELSKQYTIEYFINAWLKVIKNSKNTLKN